MLKIKEAVLVEGNYDKVKLASFLDAVIVTTDGFRIFHNKEKLALLKTLAQTTGVIILTDSDRAGFAIRNFVKQGIDKSRIKHAYIPSMPGKERRKSAPSKEGLLGVEGMERERILAALLRAGATVLEDTAPEPKMADGRKLTKADLYADGFTGGADSAQKRRALLMRLNLPQRMSSNMLLDVLNSAIGYDAYRAAADAALAEFDKK